MTARPPADAEGDIALAQRRAAGVITLKRPSACDPLRRPGRAAIADALSRWARDPEIYGAIVRAEGAAAFDGGGGLPMPTRCCGAWNALPSRPYR